MRLQANGLVNEGKCRQQPKLEPGNEWSRSRRLLELELEMLISKNAWVIVEQTPGMKVIPSTRAFKCKRFPDGLVRKLKSRFCIHSDCQIDGVNVFDAYAPVMSWTTIRLLLILSVVLNLATKQVDYMAAFFQAKLNEGEQVYVEMP
jgi:hypothetical protein